MCDYTGLNFFEIDELDVFTFWAFMRDAIIFNCNQSENGKEYLEKCWIMEQTEPDRQSLREKFGTRSIS